MKRGVWVALSAVGVVLAASGLYRVSAQESADAPPAFKPASPLEDLMEVNQDQFKTLRKNMTPQPDFEKIRHSAYVIAEIGNVAGYHQPASEADWWRFSEGLKSTALDIATAAEEENADALATAVRNLGATCKSCHDRYKQ